MRENLALQFRTDAFNAFNHAQFLNPDNNMSDTNFGKITTTAAGRIFQFAMKIVW